VAGTVDKGGIGVVRSPNDHYSQVEGGTPGEYIARMIHVPANNRHPLFHLVSCCADRGSTRVHWLDATRVGTGCLLRRFKPFRRCWKLKVCASMIIDKYMYSPPAPSLQNSMIHLKECRPMRKSIDIAHV